MSTQENLETLRLYYPAISYFSFSLLFLMFGVIQFLKVWYR